MDKGNVWDERAQAYRESAPHASGPDLDLLGEWAGLGAGRTALDVGTGGGHLARRRLREAGFTVTTSDPSPGMQPDVICRAEELPFPAASFDLVASRLGLSPLRRYRARAGRDGASGERARPARGSALRRRAGRRGRDDTRPIARPRPLARAMARALRRLRARDRANRADRSPDLLQRLARALQLHGQDGRASRGLVPHRLDGDNYTSTIFLLRAVKTL